MSINTEAFYDMSYGLYIVSSSAAGRHNGQITNTVFQITSNPPVIAASICKENLTHEYIDKSGFFSVSVLEEKTPMVFIGLFGFKCGRTVDKFENVKYKIAPSGIAVVTEHIVSAFEMKVINKVDAGTHTLFIGEVLNSETLSNEKPMTYDYYRTVLRGKTPRNATTYNKEPI